MKKFILILLLILLAIFVARFLFGGNEDTWICGNGQWVKHGNPSAPMPETGCGEVENDWQSQTIEEIGLSFKYPKGTTFRKEIADDSAGIRAVGFYVEKEGYTLYGLYQPKSEATEEDLEKTKTEMDTATIKEVTIDGHKGIEGLILGPKTRHLTTIVKDGKLFSVSTMPPTEENKNLTDEILATFDFE